MIEPASPTKGKGRSRLVIWIAVGCGALLVGFICLAAVLFVTSFVPEETEAEPTTTAVASAEVAGAKEDDGQRESAAEAGGAGEALESERSGTPTATTGPTETPEPTATAEPTETPRPTATSTPLPEGLSRSHPFTNTVVVTAPNWDVEVIDVIRGDAAWNQIQSANQFNEPPPEGMEYLLVNLRVRSTYADEQSQFIGGSDFKVTGDRYLCYGSSSVVAPDPELDAELASGGETTGWVPFLVGADEGNLMLVVDELANFDDDRFRYIALEPDASVGVPAELAAIDPTDAGRTRENPLAPGSTATTEDWELTVLEVIRGDEAWTRIQQANQFNEPPAEGMEYLLMRVGVRNISTIDTHRNLDEFAFNPTGSAYVLHDLPSVVSPKPVLDACLYPGGYVEGWVSMQVYTDEIDLMALFEPPFEWFDDKNVRFLALEEGASLTVPGELAEIEPNGLGEERSDPAPFGETVVTEDWEVTVQDVVRGDDAWTMAQEANQFNDPPEEGMEYVAVRAHVRYIGTEDDPASIDAFAFNTIGDANVVYDVPSVVEPEPALSVWLYPGGEYEGWIMMQAAEGEENLLLTFSEGFFSSDRYLSLEP